ncbi:PAC2 family protein [Nesterenkonia aerolata]|uniref:PAC2 family protein n=1 Tax=Nesterenkonia aerolata TaxID=3074079 RepID=A0ABU2DRR5_9MICC|nr:PAC2 family protein [Nesterenkonia sp. LY-0111]MDR8019169.1 PAC2 family protein [Nesterenkonia sp. LY-0111]
MNDPMDLVDVEPDDPAHWQNQTTAESSASGDTQAEGDGPDDAGQSQADRGQADRGQASRADDEREAAEPHAEETAESAEAQDESLGSLERVLSGAVGPDRGDGEAPTLLVSLTGHTDAGTLSRQLSETLLGGLPHRRLAGFHTDEIFDFRSRRPRMTFTEGRFQDYQGPDLGLYELRDAMDRPFLLLTGDEPDFRWQQVIDAVVEMVDRLDVGLTVVVDSLGLPVPHTRPLGVTAHGTRDDLIEGISTWSPSAQLEAGIHQVLELRLQEAGRDVVGYSLHVPHYLASGRYPQVAVSALEYAGAAMEVMLPTDELRESARQVEQDIASQTADNAEIQALVERLERNFDQYASTTQRSLLVKDDDAVPDAEELGAAVEEFLRMRPMQSPEDTAAGSAGDPRQKQNERQDEEQDKGWGD